MTPTKYSPYTQATGRIMYDRGRLENNSVDQIREKIAALKASRQRNLGVTCTGSNRYGAYEQAVASVNDANMTIVAYEQEIAHRQAVAA